MDNLIFLQDGRKLFESAENVRRSSQELDALMGSLWELALGTAFNGGNLKDWGEESNRNDGWIVPAYAYNGKVELASKRSHAQRARDKRLQQIGSISFIVRLCNSGDLNHDAPNWPWLDQVCLIIGWHPKQHSDESWEVADFCPKDSGQSNIHHLGSGLWSWREIDTEVDYAYFFALPVFLLRNEYDLKRFAIDPLVRLFGKSSPIEGAGIALLGIPVLLPKV